MDSETTRDAVLAMLDGMDSLARAVTAVAEKAGGDVDVTLVREQVQDARDGMRRAYDCVQPRGSAGPRRHSRDW